MSSAKKSGAASKGSQKRRERRKRLQNACTGNDSQDLNILAESKPKKEIGHHHKEFLTDQENDGSCNCSDCSIPKVNIGTMTNDPVESREKVKAAREAKKLAKQEAKMKRDAGLDFKPPAKVQAGVKNQDNSKELAQEVKTGNEPKEIKVENKVACTVKEQPNKSKSIVGSREMLLRSEDQVDRAGIPIDGMDTVKVIMGQISLGKERVIAEIAAHKAAKDKKKKDIPSSVVSVPGAKLDMTVKDVASTLQDIQQLAQEVKDVAVQVKAFSIETHVPKKKSSKLRAIEPRSTPTTHNLAPPKTKAELRAERRAKQDAQRLAKESTAQVKTASAKPKELNAQPGKEVSSTVVKEKPLKSKTPKQTAKPQGHKVSWFRHLYNEDDKEKLNKIPINSNLHPAIIKLGVQLSTRVVTGSNARCIALLDALKKMVQDYSLPAKTEFGRGLDAHLASSLEFLWSMRQPTASQTNAVKFFRHHLMQLPNNVDEFDAKKTLQEEIDRYIREQIEMAGEAISIAVRNKICKGDCILTYGCSSLIERIFVDAHLAGVEFRAVVCGGGVSAQAAREMTRRLVASGVPCICVDITALSFIMRTMNKVVLGCSALLANGSVLGAAGTAAVALAARAFNKPVLVACETHKFTDRVQTDAFVYNEIGDPDELIDKSDENSPLKDWRSNPNLTPLNLTYDVTPPNLVTAVVTELAILPCTSAPVVLRFKLSEYSI